MATKEVIEVGSSDDEAEPPPKKMKPVRKPVPNAMVHIPSRLPGISIKPASNFSQNTSTKVAMNKSTTQRIVVPNTGSKSNVLINPLVNQLKNNSVTITKASNTVVYFKDPLVPPIINAVIKKQSLNQNKNNMSRVQVKKVQPQGHKRAGTSVLSNLPSSITIKKAPSTKTINLPAKALVTQKQIKKKPKQLVMDIPTVDLDDEEVAEQQTSSNPQWYMRPEDSLKIDQNIDDDDSGNINFEEQNNQEPETPKYVEITIEDSPIKPPERDFNEIGTELPVIIEDSPCKNDISDERKSNHIKQKKDAHSRKKLNYPKDTQNVRQVVEIEIDPIATTNIVTECNEDKSEDHPKEQPENKTDEKCEPTSQNVKVQEEEFNPTYQEFIDTCFKIENSDDMKKIVEKKIKAYYKQCPKVYVESEEFLDMVASKTASIKAGPDKMYLFIKDVVDELNMQRKLAKAQEPKKEDVSKIAEESFITKGEEGEYGTKRARQIRKLEKTIKQLHKAIQKLEEQEVDLADEENSMYLLTERYKERLVRVHAKFRQMTNTKMPSEPRIVIESRPGCPQGPAKKLEKFVNKKVPIGAPLPFPDFHDVLRCVRDANQEDELGWSNMEIEAEARDLFERCGKKLKRRRQENEWRISVVSRIPTDSQDRDPAENNAELKRKLSENKVIAAKRESEVLNKYADRQRQLKLEPEEIGDKEAEESVGESEEEEAGDSHLADKEKRKEILKRLIQDKNKKALSKNVDAPPGDADNNSKNSNPEEKSINVNVPDDNENKEESEIQKISHMETDNLNSNDVIDIDSDEDELHLLQKLRFEDERIASSSDSDSTIAISDSSESETDDENDKIICSDIISIENSSFSESEALPEEGDGLSNIAIEVRNDVTQAQVAEVLEDATITDNTNDDKTNDDKVNKDECMENIVLAISEEDSNSEKDVTSGEIGTCANLNDDVLSLTETIVDGDNDLNKDTENCSFSESEALPEEGDGLSKIAIEVRNDVTQAQVAEVLEDTTITDKTNDDKTNDDKVNKDECMKNIVVAISEEDSNSEKDVNLGEIETCANLNDDVLSLTETVVVGDNDLNKDTDDMDKDIDSTVHVNNLGAEEIQSNNGYNITPIDASEQASLNDNEKAPKININKDVDENVDNTIGEIQEEV